MERDWGKMKEEVTPSSFDNILCPQLKDTYMIIFYPKNINNNFLDFFNYYKNVDYIPYCSCPNCGSRNLIKWGSYLRNLYFLSSNIIKFKIIKIKRIRCKDCGKTHALIPSDIIPYKLHSLDIILSAIANDYFSLNMNYDTISKWNKEFNKFIPYLKTMFNNITKNEILTKLKDNIFYGYKLFYTLNKKILMMMRHGVYDMAVF